MKAILIVIFPLLMYSCQHEPGLRLPSQLAIVNSSSMYLGAEKIDIERSRKLIENRELSTYTSSGYYEKLDNHPFFTHIACKFSWSRLSMIILSRNIDNQNVMIDTIAIKLVKIFQENYGEDYTVYQRNEGLMKMPALCWYISDKGYITLYYVPYRIFKQYYAQDKFTPNELIVELSTTKDKWLESTVRYTKSNLGLDSL